MSVPVRRVRLLDFSAGIPRWRAVGDPAMGGISTGSVLAAGGRAAFTGAVSQEHGGGFASVWFPLPPGALLGASRLLLFVMGDGRRYRVALRGGAAGGTVHRATVAPPRGRWSELSLPLDAFEPVRRGRPLPAAPLEPGAVRELGLVAPRPAGPFRLELGWIDAILEVTP